MYQRMESSDYQTVSQEESSQNDTMIFLHEEKLYVRKGETLKIDKIKKKSFTYRKLLLFLQKIQTMANRDYKLMLLEDAEQFLASLPENVRFKITYNIRRVLAGEINKELFAKLDDSDGIWEFRTLYQKTKYRLFSFWDKEKDTIIIATHGIVKKTQKTPPKEIAKAEEIKKKYFELKEKKKWKK